MADSQPDPRLVNSVFGAELPQASPDERDTDAPGEIDDRDRWLRENVPPHHI